MLTFLASFFAPPRDLIPVVIATWIGVTFAEKRAARYNLKVEVFNNFVFYSIGAFLLVGGYKAIAFNLSAFPNILRIIQINIELFDVWQGCAGAIIVAILLGYRFKLPLWRTLDVLSFLFASVAIGIGFSHLASGSAFGKETTLPWGIHLWGAKRHPTQIYEITVSFLTLGLLWLQKTELVPGTTFFKFIAFTSAGRLFIEAFRGDSILILNGVRLAQVIAWVALAVTLFASESIHQRRKNQ